MKAFDVKSCVIGAALGVAIFLGVGAGQNRVDRGSFEHKIVQGTVYGADLTLEKYMNREAENGWELVSVHHSQQQFGFAVLRRLKAGG